MQMLELVPAAQPSSLGGDSLVHRQPLKPLTVCRDTAQEHKGHQKPAR